ncbi:glycosyl hydrolase 115 family protein [uncultured Duncaniella sp.]|uniref:glycosyl hydrolase 115 family protein n=1 Tax=uncultured Duncaniella sp. TaxID=2768039 RepID=UPI0025E2075C|nr:glycosyl hydrolase 115 family protein [uncultured Duncaniella sp.]
MTHSPIHLLRHGIAGTLLFVTPFSLSALDHKGITSETPSPDNFTLIANSIPTGICVASDDAKGVGIAVNNLADDFGRVCGNKAQVSGNPDGKSKIIVGTINNPLILELVKAGKLDASQLKGKTEKYVMTTISNPFPGMDEALVIAGSDRRGTIYGVYELSEQLGVSPWYDWADVPVRHRSDLSIARGTYTAGEPAVRYRGIFLNDEAPCLTSWVKNTYGTGYGDHRFYSRVFELLLRLRGNFLWPAMWGWAFYADDPDNARTADEMGIIIGTSHHEPMARNHQEWARHRKDYGAWNYSTNRTVLDRFFAEGIRRMKGSEDVVTIGMRGDGDEAMSAEADVKLLESVIANQRKIIKKETGRSASETPQVWALYKEVLDYYDAGMRVPDDVTLLLCDDNWGNVRRLPNDEERKHPGGWGMYYHVDYVGAPRNSKLLNCTPIQNMWEQMTLTYDYGVDRLWILNVGDLKPMEYPITLFLDMAWNPHRHSAADILDHPRDFFAQQFGESQAAEAARIFNLLCKYNGRGTPEMLDRNTYSLEDGEWQRVTDDYARLEAEALRQYLTLPEDSRDAYMQLILFPLQLMGNLYEMYYSQAMNHRLHSLGLPEANEWADRTERCFARDAELMHTYNKVMSNGKWDGMMTQKHIGYTSWNDSFERDTLPEIRRIPISISDLSDKSDLSDSSEKPENPEKPENSKNSGSSSIRPLSGYQFSPSNGCVIIEAPHIYSTTEPEKGNGRWTLLPDVGRTLGALAVMPYTAPLDGASLSYSLSLPADVDSVKVHVIVKSTLAFSRLEGHRYKVGFDGGESITVNFNSDLNEAPENIYDIFYPTVARRVVEKTVTLPVSPAVRNANSAEANTDCPLLLTLSPLDPGIVFEKIVIDFGGYRPSYLFGQESPCHRNQSY